MQLGTQMRGWEDGGIVGENVKVLSLIHRVPFARGDAGDFPLSGLYNSASAELF